MKTLIYIPALLILSIFYSRLSSIGQETNSHLSAISSSRAPASSASNFEVNEGFYLFYRSFVPLFYKTVKENKKIAKIFSLKKYVSTIGGDVHVENFGFVIDDKKKASLSLNDYDDTTEGELYLDVLRHFISASIVTKDISWKQYLSAYEKGIRAEKFNFSINTEKKLDSTLAETEKILDETIGSAVPVKFQKYKKPNRPLTKVEILQVTKALKEKYSQIEIYDHYARIKEDGGSAGMLRYELLVRLTPKEKITWIDVKETEVSSYDKIFTSSNNISSYNSRLNHLKENLFDGKINNSIDVIDIDKKKFSIRSMDHFSIGISLNKIDEADYGDLVLDEAYALGISHASSLKARSFNPDEYANEWEKIQKSDLNEISNSIKEELENQYQNSKKGE